MRALAVVFGKTALAEAAQFEPLPEEAAWTDDLRPALMWRCAQGLKKLDSVLGGEKWRARRPRRMADVHMLAEEAVAALRGRPGARTSSTAGRTRRVRSRSPSSSSASGGSGKRGKVKRGAVAEDKSFAVSSDVAEALHKGKSFYARADDDVSGGGSVGDAVASVPSELRGLLRRALISDKVTSRGESKSARQSVPAFVERARAALEREVRRALEVHVKEDMSGRSELGRSTAEKLAMDVRRLQINLQRIIEAVRAARGSRAPPANLVLELQDAWGLIRAGLLALDRAVPVAGRATEQVAGQISTGAVAAGVSSAKCKEWVLKVLTTLSVDAADWRQDAGAPAPTLAAAVAGRAQWLLGEISDARSYSEGARAAASAVSGMGKKGDRQPRGGGGGGDADRSRDQGERSGKGAVRPGGGAQRLWADKPIIPDDKFSCLKAAFMQKHKEYCWGNLMHGCARGDACREKHKWPPGFAATCKGCNVTPPKATS